MSYYKELDVIIQDKVDYNPDTRENEYAYLQLRDEVNECKEVTAHGQLAFDQMSPVAQDVIREWESWIENEIEHNCDYAEQPEDF